ncbi:DNA-binding response regulator [Chitinophaga caeni]|uniref:DNA-binding response regulator n=1 Tax=Chitinophaga caeni TaxID=2029983 RepID=A0A291QYI3_9BACT|nr:response regulator transcription factor [Chitinophaga caeni]ATL49089.1 DNA-binding response regulator [Chitinophaga caeni]
MKAHYDLIIVDDHQLFVDGLVRILEDEPIFSVIGTCNNGTELKHLLNGSHPDLVMLDIQMAGSNGIKICKELKTKYPGLKIILISMFESANIIQEIKHAGADGYIPKSTDADLVKVTITDVLSGKAVFIKPSRTEHLDDLGSGNNAYLISQREKEIIEYIKDGLTSKRIAEVLHISQYTVETHRKNIMKKLNLGSIKELISYAYKHNI